MCHFQADTSFTHDLLVAILFVNLAFAQFAVEICSTLKSQHQHYWGIQQVGWTPEANWTSCAPWGQVSQSCPRTPSHLKIITSLKSRKSNQMKPEPIQEKWELIGRLFDHLASLQGLIPYVEACMLHVKYILLMKNVRETIQRKVMICFLFTITET